jgi:hypothetical protein
MKPFMETLALFLSCNVNTYINNLGVELLSVNVSYIDSVKFLIDYFDKYPLLGAKSKGYDKWLIVYNMIITKDHLTEEGRLKIKSILNMT